MENPAFDIYYEKKKKEAREIYDQYGRLWCPILNDYVSFNNIGFRHFIWKGNNRARSRVQQMNIREKYIRVVIKQDGNGYKHFLSVFEGDKQKTARG